MGHQLLMHYHAIKAIQFKTNCHVTHDISDHDSSLEEKWHVPSFSNNDGLIFGFFGFPYFFVLLHKIISFLKARCILTFIHTFKKNYVGISNECDAIISSPFIGIC
jgi:hypothetical protein